MPYGGLSRITRAALSGTSFCMNIMGLGNWLWVLVLIAVIVLPANRGVAEAPPQETGETGLTVSQVVDRLVGENAQRAMALKGYRSRRSYRLDYKGFPSDLHAEMTVDMIYKAPATKEFVVVSEGGSKWIIHHIFKRLLESEREALHGENRERTALNSQNYDFTMLRDDGEAQGCPYVLGVEPKAPDKFLYRGRIWVNAKDYAVCRIEAEPAKNPSFWITKTAIHHTYSKIGDFWLPASNQSLSTLRWGGRATLTIQYQDYKILEADSPHQTVEKVSPASSIRSVTN